MPKKKYNVRINSLAPILERALNARKCNRCGSGFVPENDDYGICDKCLEALNAMYPSKPARVYQILPELFD